MGEQEFTLRVGERARITEQARTVREDIVYCGMPDRSRYSIAVVHDEYRAVHSGAGFQGYSTNLYFSKSTRDLTIADRKLKVRLVTPQQIVLQYVDGAEAEEKNTDSEQELQALAGRAIF